MDKSTKPNAPWYIKLFVLFHVACITAWTIPNARDPQINGSEKIPPFAIGDWVRVADNRYVKTWHPLTDYLFVTGFWQYWDMFAPNPASIDRYVDAVVEYKDGSTRKFAYPRVFSLPIQNKFAQERYRKYYERANDDQYSFLWPQFALHIAFECDNPANPPVKIRLTRHWLQIAAPGKKQDTQYSSYMYFEYIVDQRALSRMREGRA